MNKEEILKYAKVFSQAKGDTYKIHFVNENKTINEPDLWKETLNLIDKLQKEIEELQEETKSKKKQIKLMQEEYKKGDFIHKGFIRDKIKELEEQHDIEKDMYKRLDIEAQIEVLEELLEE